MEASEYYARNVSLIENGDLAVFKIGSQSSPDDKRSLLVLQNIVRQNVSAYTYLEIGSFMGGTLVPHLADPRCRLVYSVDKRPESQLDERGRSFDYADSTTAKMVAGLEAIHPMASMIKLQTIDGDISDIEPSRIGGECDFIFIDGEHTNQAVFRDFMHARKYAKDSAIIAFHDSQYIFDSLANIDVLMAMEGRKFKSFVLPSCLFVVLLGDYVEAAGPVVERLSLSKAQYFTESKTSLWREIARNNRE